MTEVLIADASFVLREGLAAVLLQDGMSVAGKVGSVFSLQPALGGPQAPWVAA